MKGRPGGIWRVRPGVLVHPSVPVTHDVGDVKGSKVLRLWPSAGDEVPGVFHRVDRAEAGDGGGLRRWSGR